MHVWVVSCLFALVLGTFPAGATPTVYSGISSLLLIRTIVSEVLHVSFLVVLTSRNGYLRSAGSSPTKCKADYFIFALNPLDTRLDQSAGDLFTTCVCFLLQEFFGFPAVETRC